MKKGGYQILDLKGLNLLSNKSVNIGGLYETIESTLKTVLVCGIVIDGNEYHDTFAEIITTDSKYSLSIYGYTLNIDSNNDVSIEEEIKAYVEVHSFKFSYAYAPQLFVIEEGYLYKFYNENLTILTTSGSETVKTAVKNFSAYVLNGEFLSSVPTNPFEQGGRFGITVSSSVANSTVIVTREKISRTFKTQ